MDIYEVTTEYVEYLRRFEPTKILKNNDDKSNRKFVGVIVQNGQHKYVVPLSSPKFLGKIQCNNMIPVPESEIKKLDLDGMEDIAYKSLVQKQIQFIRKNADDIVKKHINPVYINRKKNRMDIGYIKNATPDFDLLEKKCREWEYKK